MSKERIQISEALYDIMPSDYQDLVKSATYGKEDRGWKDIGSSKELIEQHSLCAGCPESMAFRYILASLPNPEDTVMVGSTGCTSLVFPMVAVHNIHSLFGNYLKSWLCLITSPKNPPGKVHDNLLRQRTLRQHRRSGERIDAEGFRRQDGAGRQTVRQGAAPGDRPGVRLSLRRELHGQQAVIG